MNLIKTKTYPKTGIYRGPATKIIIDFTTLRIGIEFIDNYIYSLIEKAFEHEIRNNNGIMLKIDVYNEETSSYLVPLYNWRFECIYYDDPAAIGVKAVPVIVVQGIVATIITLSVAYLIKISGTQATNIIYGPPIRDDEIRGPSLVMAITLGILVMSASYAYKLYKER